ncbi:ABC transporter substrate-binding protein [Clostridiales Family XIII bacterium BX16]|uniref:ABC transporter substrate-binding protein n=1 Tax=Lentihominibacter faecis TaxID=2764712 RepID=A0A923NBM3_9FIRM|nr:ABC transporter substrate-binding protein [Lentihominibacter faecis]
MKIRKIAAVAVTAVLTVTMLTGCTTFNNFKEAFLQQKKSSDVTIQIGIYEPMSGADSDAAKAEIKGIELAHEVYPNIGGKIVELVYSDNSSDIDAAETAINNLISKKPDIILGSYGSVYSMIAGKPVNDAKIPAIAITNDNPLVTKNYPYYFRVCYVDSNQGDLLAKYVLEQKQETTAGVLIPNNDDVAMAMATTFVDRIEAETENEDAITAYETYKPGQKDFTKPLKAIQESGVKSVLLPGDSADSANIINQAADLGMDVMFLGPTDWSSKEFRSELSSSVSKEHLAFVNFFTADDTINQESEKFLEAYHEKYGKDKEPEDSVALGYDAYLIAINAVNDAGNDPSGNDIRKVLASAKEFQGASGNITFNTEGDPLRSAQISTWEGKKIVSTYTVEPY